jgi:hypothetical protein
MEKWGLGFVQSLYGPESYIFGMLVPKPSLTGPPKGCETDGLCGKPTDEEVRERGGHNMGWNIRNFRSAEAARIRLHMPRTFSWAP